VRALDSVVESSSATVLIWRLRNESSQRWDVESIEKRAFASWRSLSGH
jgi:hypothetical protein